VKIFWPLCFNDQTVIISASVLPTSAARVSATFLSKRASSSVRDPGAVFGASPPRSSSGWFSVGAPQLGIVATCVASSTSDIDFGCGFHANLSSGTRSSSLRVTPIS
jgi:hypothetical protein